MQQQAISIETLGDLVAHDYRLNAMCERCRHRAHLDIRPHIHAMALSDSDLTDATKRVDEARERLERQRELVQQLRASTSEAEALLQTMQATLEALEGDLRQIEDEMVGAKSDQR